MQIAKTYIIFFAIILLLISGIRLLYPKVAKIATIPDSFILRVPFSTQAPTNNWIRNKDCEETSLAMVDAFLKGNTESNIASFPAQATIDSLKKWEDVNLGYNADTGASATTKMAEGALGLKIKTIQDFTETDLKIEIMKGLPILLPINAKLLGSSQYLENGPTYHMIVIRGFREHTFIVNDPGTNTGDANEYSFKTLQKAAADWDHNTKTIQDKIKIALVVSR